MASGTQSRAMAGGNQPGRKNRNQKRAGGATGNYQDSFRDHLSTVNEEGKRNWIYPKKPSGAWYTKRNAVAALLLLFFFSAPFIRIGGQPLLLLNILERKFVVFGIAFWPQDFWLVVAGFLSLVLFIVLFTAIFGRLWCGWACPQTIFMEMVFRRIEYWIEGDRSAQIRLNRQPWNREKIFKKTLKHGIFFGLSFVIANLFLAYIIGVEQLFVIITDPPSQHLAGLASITLFSGAFYGVFAFLREQVCHFICPYGRMQSVLIDNNSINVMYDYRRGEQRGSVAARKKADPAENWLNTSLFGDCIDCNQCVVVCPMGIDIRNGTQMECIQCTACIDACDHVMEKIGKPKGLIRYSSINAIAEGSSRIFTPRVAGYSAILLILISIFVVQLGMRPDTQTIILRQPGTLYQALPGNRYSNIYELKMVNKTFDPIEYEIRLEEPAAGELTPLGEFGILPPQEAASGRFLITLPGTALKGSSTPLLFGVYADGEQVETIRSSFAGPGM